MGWDGMSGGRRVPEIGKSPKGVTQKRITECESDPQRDDFEGLGDVAALLTMEVLVRCDFDLDCDCDCAGCDFAPGSFAAAFAAFSAAAFASSSAEGAG